VKRSTTATLSCKTQPDRTIL